MTDPRYDPSATRREAGDGGAGAAADPPEPPRLRVLRRLVTALLAVLIVGMIVIASTLVIRVNSLTGGGGASGSPGFAQPLGPVSAERIALPDGARIIALGRASGEILVLVEEPGGRQSIRGFDATTGTALWQLAVERD